MLQVPLEGLDLKVLQGSLVLQVLWVGKGPQDPVVQLVQQDQLEPVVKLVARAQLVQKGHLAQMDQLEVQAAKGHLDQQV